jgi:hypothetical protein
MSLEEANYVVRFSIDYSPSGWYFTVDTRRPFGTIVGYNKFPTADEAVEELKQFLRYFTENVLKDGDSIRKYVEKHKPKKNED